MTGGSEPSAHYDSAAQRVILLLEDNFWTRYTAGEFLRGMGYRVIEGKDADEGVSVLAAGTRVDVIFTDVWMPGSLDGLQFARWVAERHPHIPVLLTSGTPPTDGALQHGILRRFISKPYFLFDVERELRSLL